MDPDSNVDHTVITVRDVDAQIAAEQVPLLGRIHQRTSISHLIFPPMLALFTIFGLTIGIYLLFEQETEWKPSFGFHLIKRFQWSDSESTPLKYLSSELESLPSIVLVTQTGTQQCNERVECYKILRALQNESHYGIKEPIPFNFLISSDGITYEGIGYKAIGDIDFQWDYWSLSVAFIGNYTVHKPPQHQLLELQAFISASIRIGRLDSLYTIKGKTLDERPEKLFDALSMLPHWNGEV